MEKIVVGVGIRYGFFHPNTRTRPVFGNESVRLIFVGSRDKKWSGLRVIAEDFETDMVSYDKEDYC